MDQDIYEVARSASGTEQTYWRAVRSAMSKKPTIIIYGVSLHIEKFCTASLLLNRLRYPNRLYSRAKRSFVGILAVSFSF